jgi:hypothetical protein
MPEFTIVNGGGRLGQETSVSLSWKQKIVMDMAIGLMRAKI